jgi:single stranded DNA-binding protein
MTVFSSGRNKTTFTVAINHPGRKLANGARTEGTADFIKVEAWGKLAEIAHKYLAKGSQVTVCGPFRTDRWVDRDGKERMTPLVEAQYLALPPRLRVVDQPKQAAAVAGGNTITGDMVFPDEPDEPDEFVGEDPEIETEAESNSGSNSGSEFTSERVSEETPLVSQSAAMLFSDKVSVSR